MTTREKIAHLTRRFGFGCTPAELDAYEKKGLEGTIEALIEFEKTPADFPFDPWEFAFYGQKEVALDPGRFLGWWCMRMVLTQRPLEEKLTVFWHDHFAISGSKVEFGPLMLRNNQTLRALGIGKFKDLLAAMAQDPAMILWLDCDSNVKGAPNENYAREVMELFSLGVGHYTEKDVQEAARAFTGWGLRYAVTDANKTPLYEQAINAVKANRPLITSAYSPELHDDGPKTILGQSANFDWQSASAMLAGRPEAARLITTKLWEFFAYSKPEVEVVDRLAQTFRASDGSIRAVLYAIARSPEFYSEKCVRKLVKSPVDFVIPIVRQLNARAIMMGFRKKDSQPWTPVANEIAGVAGLCAGSMLKMGMLLFYPPNVAGWDWGTAWITTDSMSERLKFADVLFQTAPDRAVAELVRMQMLMAGKGQSEEDVISWLATGFDVPLDPAKKAVLLEAFRKNGGTESIKDKMAASKSLGTVVRLMFGMPEFQFC